LPKTLIPLLGCCSNNLLLTGRADFSAGRNFAVVLRHAPSEPLREAGIPTDRESSGQQPAGIFCEIWINPEVGFFFTTQLQERTAILAIN